MPLARTTCSTAPARGTAPRPASDTPPAPRRSARASISRSPVPGWLAASALSVWAVSVAAGLTIGSPPAMDLAPAVEIALRALASAGGVLGFALMFNTPWKMALTSAGIGMVGNVARLEMVDRGVVVQAATTLSCVIIGVLAAWAAPRIASPNITLSVPAVLIMVPGVAAYL